MFRVVHTADWHLGKSMFGRRLISDQRWVLEQLLVHVGEHRVDLVVVAGDVFDRSIPPLEALQLFDEVMQRLVNLGATVVIISGNHDSSERLGYASRFLKLSGVHVITQGPEHQWAPLVLKNSDLVVNVFPLPYQEPQWHWSSTNEGAAAAPQGTVQDPLLSWLEQLSLELPQSSRDFNLAVSHCFVSGGSECDSERVLGPLAVGGLGQFSADAFAAFDYAALGHLHSPQKLCGGKVRYSGSLLKYSFSEVHQKKGFWSLLITPGSAGERPTFCADFVPFSPWRDVRVVEGTLEELLAAGESAAAVGESAGLSKASVTGASQHEEPLKNGDYLLARVTDKELILDLISTLRRVYPNILHIERPYFEVQRARQTLPSQEISRVGSELRLFESFVRTVTNTPQEEALPSGFSQVFAEALDEVRRGEEA